MRKLLAFVLAGWLLACAENKALVHGEEHTARKQTLVCDEAIDEQAAQALVCQLWEKMDQNKYVINTVAHALEKMGPKAGNALAHAIGQGVEAAKVDPTEQGQKKALHVAQRAAMILGRIGGKVACNTYVVVQLINAAQCKPDIQIGCVDKEALQEARRAAIEALGKIFEAKKCKNAKNANLYLSVITLTCLLQDCDPTIKVLSAEALAQIYGQPEFEWGPLQRLWYYLWR